MRPLVIRPESILAYHLIPLDDQTYSKRYGSEFVVLADGQRKQPFFLGLRRIE